MNWQELAATSPYRTATAVEEALEKGNIAEARVGMEELIEALSRSDKRALKSHLIRLMTHIIKWQTQPDKRSRSWRASIYNAREEIADIQDDTPSLTRNVIEAMWDRCLQVAKRDAEADMNDKSTLDKLTWEDVFEKEYELEE